MFLKENVRVLYLAVTLKMYTPQTFVYTPNFKFLQTTLTIICSLNYRPPLFF